MAKSRKVADPAAGLFSNPQQQEVRKAPVQEIPTIVESPVVEEVEKVEKPKKEKLELMNFYASERYKRAMALRKYKNPKTNNSKIIRDALDVALAEELKQVDAENPY